MQDGAISNDLVQTLMVIRCKWGLTNQCLYNVNVSNLLFVLIYVNCIFVFKTYLITSYIDFDFRHLMVQFRVMSVVFSVMPRQCGITFVSGARHLVPFLSMYSELLLLPHEIHTPNSTLSLDYYVVAAVWTNPCYLWRNGEEEEEYLLSRPVPTTFSTTPPSSLNLTV